MESITVNGQKLAIDPSVFTTSSNRGTIVDSGTTLAYLAEDAYDPLINAVISCYSISFTEMLKRMIISTCEVYVEDDLSRTLDIFILYC